MRRAASRQLKATPNTASRTEAAGDASTWAAPRQLLQAAHLTSDELTVLYSNGPDDRSVKLAHLTARRMEAADAARTRAAPSQSLDLQAARSACGAHSRSPTVRRRSYPQHDLSNITLSPRR
jgi:hypothetical protein